MQNSGARVSKLLPVAGVLLVVLSSTGCRVLSPAAVPVVSQQFAPELIDQQSQIEVGKPHRIIDSIGWVVGIPDKLLLWDRRVDQHRISEDTLLTVADYLEYNNLPHVKVRANQYAPLEDWDRLTKNTTVAWPWRYSLGTLSVVGEAVFPGRIVGGDHYNPFTQTIHLYSDVPSIGLHEAAHAKDFTRREYQGSYAAAYLLLPIWHETHASRDVFAYLDHLGSESEICEANRILYPAYATYVGQGLGNLAPAYSFPLYYGSVLAGHINGRMLSKQLQENLPARAQTSLTESATVAQLDLPIATGK